MKERGDTIIEVTIALAILGMVMASSFSLATRAMRLGQSAKERTEVANLQQRQAEGLRNLRDNSSSWSVFTGHFTAGNTYHMVNSGGSWGVSNGALVQGFYTLSLVPSLTGDPNRYQFDITTSWAPLGGGGFTNETTLRTYLVNLDGMRPL